MTVTRSRDRCGRPSATDHRTRLSRSVGAHRDALTLQTFVDRLVRESTQPPELPAFPFDPAESALGRLARKRPNEDYDYLEAVGRQRVMLSEAYGDARDEVERWRTQAMALVRELAAIALPSAPPPQRYVLHRTLANATDIFSTPSSRALTADELAAIGQAVDTDLVALGDVPLEPSLRPPPTLGEINAGQAKILPPPARPGTLGATYQAPSSGAPGPFAA